MKGTKLILAVLVVAGASSVVGCSVESDPAGELYDFSTTTEPSVGGMPYDQYVQLATQSGLEVLGFGEVESRAQTICAARLPGEDMTVPTSGNDAAILQAYCPELGLGP